MKTPARKTAERSLRALRRARPLRAGSRASLVELLELEPRVFLSATNPSLMEQQSLFLINRMRTAPLEELALLLNANDAQINSALTHFNVDIALLTQQFNALVAVPPVSWNSTLASTSAAHNELMLQYDTQSHQLPGELSLGARILAAGYDYAWVGENVYAYAYSARYAHAGFAIDWGNGPNDIGGIQTPPGHRNTIMSSNLKEVGIAFKLDTNPNNTVGPYLVTQDFGRTLTASNPYVLGTVYNDKNNNDYLDSLEPVPSVTVTATGINGTTGVFQTTSLTAGGYQLQLPAGSYQITFGENGSTIPAPQSFQVTVASSNILLNLDTSEITAAPPPEEPPPEPPVNTPPVGSIDTPVNVSLGRFNLGPRTITGFAYDAEAAANTANPSIQIRLDIDGQPGSFVTANLTRSDLPYATTAHGFSINLPWLATGEHTLTLVAVDAPAGTETTVASTTLNITSTPFGFVDAISTKSIAGWAFDPAAENPTSIRIDVDGVEYTTLTADASRPDLASLLGSQNHGFTVALANIAPGNRRIDVYALDDTTSSHTLLASKMLTFNTLPVGYLDVANKNTIAGWALDPDAPTAPVSVRIDINGSTWRTVTANTFRQDLTAIGTGFHSFNVKAPVLEAGEYEIALYAIDSLTLQPKLLGKRTFTVDLAAGPNQLPIGYLDVLNGSSLIGWAADLDAPSAPINIRVDIDGTPAYTGPTTVNRPDLLSFLPTPNHGFSINLPELNNGTHTVQVYALNYGDDAPRLIATRTTTAPAPLGYAALRSNNSRLVGWAYHPGLGATSATLSLEVDGIEVQQITANLFRADMLALFGSGNHGFAIDLPTLAPGTRQITLRILNPLNNVPVTLLNTTLEIA